MGDTIEFKTIVLQGQKIPYRLRRSTRAKNLSLRITASAGLTVVLPKRGNLKSVEPFLREKHQWILNTLARVAETSPEATKKEPEAGDPIPYLGTNRKLIVREIRGHNFSVEISAAYLQVSLPQGKESHLGQIIVLWLRRQAKALIPRRVEALSRDKEITYNRISIKNQTTRWGSCSEKQNLNFNWRLIMAPPEVLDYVIFHELAHLKELNHSKPFWKIVETWCPNYRQHKRWLREHDSLLRLW